MKSSIWNKIEPKWRYLVVLKILALVILNLIPFDLPHIWRQVDTISVAMRYWQRWTIEFDAYPLLPAVLNSGNHIGYMVMEFPLINILAAPLFYFGPSLGVTLARLLFLAMNVMLWVWAYRAWRGISIYGIDAGKAFRWLPFLGLTALYMGRFIPDTTAMFLCLIGCSYFWRKNSSPIGYILLTLGMLIKPPVVVTCAILLLKTGHLKERLRLLIMPFLAALTAGLYYIFAIPALNKLETSDKLFATNPRHPLYSFLEFFSEPLNVLKLISGNLIFPGGAFALALLFIIGRKNEAIKRFYPFLYILILMMMGIAVLDGSHSFIHAYYHMGLMPVIALLFYGIVKTKMDQKISYYLQNLLILSFVVFQITTTQFDLRNISGPVKASRIPAISECQNLKQSLPELPWNQAEVFKTEPHTYPKLGLCFSERTGHNVDAEYGFYYLTETLPGNCIQIGKSENLQVVKCKT